MPKVYNKYHNDAPLEAIYVGRPSKWGNPFIMGKDGTREEVIKKYKDMLMQTDTFWDVKRHEIRAVLKGRDLVCFCAPKPCHADILLRIANEDI